VLAGCGSHERVIAWKRIRPGPIPLPLDLPSIPNGAHLCRPPAARLFYRGIGTPFTHEAYPHGFGVRNRGRRTCVIGGRPTIGLPKNVGTPLEISAVGGTTPGYPSDGRPWGLRPGKVASEQIVTWAICDEFRGDGVRHATVEVSYESSTVRIPFITCARSGASIEVGPFEPPPLPDREERWPLRAALGRLPHTIRAGATAVYRVRLTNTSPTLFRFPYCPPIDIRVGRSDHVLTLNCKPVGSIPPRGSVEFELHTTFLRGYPPGSYRLYLAVEQIGIERDRIVASAPIHVVRP